MKQVDHILNERRLLEAAGSAFCVRLMAAYQDEKDLMLLQEWVGGDSLLSSVQSGILTHVSEAWPGLCGAQPLEQSEQRGSGRCAFAALVTWVSQALACAWCFPQGSWPVKPSNLHASHRPC